MLDITWIRAYQIKTLLQTNVIRNVLSLHKGFYWSLVRVFIGNYFEKHDMTENVSSVIRGNVITIICLNRGNQHYITIATIIIVCSLLTSVSGVTRGWAGWALRPGEIIAK